MDRSMTDKWICTVCEYIYDPQYGDPEGDVRPGTSFDRLPSEWICPDCGAPKDEFTPFADEDLEKKYDEEY